MTKDEKIRELELEVAKLNGVIEGMQKADPYRLYPRPYPAPTPSPYVNPFWYQTYCDNKTYMVTTPATVERTS
jgi:hypothetical protein